ncbi:MAG TPA: hypothetical protein DEA96_17420, partial [Leptospiraceae bacterium]|nr:hypothetical protein [Leptospiraceae bacterium]
MKAYTLERFEKKSVTYRGTEVLDTDSNAKGIPTKAYQRQIGKKGLPGIPNLTGSFLLITMLGFLFSACRAAPSIQPELPGEIQDYSVKIDDIRRTARIYVPSGFQSRKLPVIIVMHGSGSDGQSVAIQSGMSKAAQQRGFIAVYPDAMPLNPTQRADAENPRVWSDGTGRGYAGEHPENDLQFIRSLIQHVMEKLPVDEKEIHIAGFSNGGSMTFRLAREMPDLFSRVAVVAGVSWLEPSDWKRQDLLYITGRQDPVIPPNRTIRDLPYSTISRSTSVSQTLLQW